MLVFLSLVYTEALSILEHFSGLLNYCSTDLESKMKGAELSVT